jgi:uncharacterized protein YkwD
MVQRALSLAFALTVLAVCLHRDARAGSKEQSALQLSADEKKLVDLINQIRQQEKLEALVPNPVLFKVARAHSANMARQRRPGHVLDGKNPSDRLREANYHFAENWENFHYGSGKGSSTPEGAIKGWMGSPGHRANILRKTVREIGIGIARDDGGTVYYTAVFSVQRKP